MARKRREVKKIEVDYLDLDEPDEPDCYGEWGDECDEELCGLHFEQCKYITETEPF
jgi:hypothetical protein